jgi:hypothetical protein
MRVKRAERDDLILRSVRQSASRRMGHDKIAATIPHSRGAERPSHAKKNAHRKAEGAGNAGRALHPRPPVQQESTGVSNQGHTAIVRHSLRDGFNGLLRALLGDRAFLPPSPAGHELSTSVGAPRPHGFAVREKHCSSAQRIAHSTSRPPQSRSAFVTIAIRPSEERNGRMKRLIWGIPEAEYFLGQVWTAQIALKLLGNFRFWRRACKTLLRPTRERLRRGSSRVHHAVQSTTNSPGTRANSRMLAVTSVAPRRRAWAAMR